MKLALKQRTPEPRRARGTRHALFILAIGASPASAFAAQPQAAHANDAVAPEAANGAETRSQRDGGEIVPPKAKSSLDVGYPEGAAGDATVLLKLLVGKDGRVDDVRVVSGEPPFVVPAEAAARAWSFEPATRDGKPVAAWIATEIRFTEPAPESTPAPPASTPKPAGPTEQARAPVEHPEQPLEVVVRGQRSEVSRRLSRAEVRQLPGAFGDPFRALEALPGVTPIASGLPYFYVRGAPPGNVGYFFDGIAVPTLYHAAAGPAVIHPAFIDEVSLYPGAYPARYRGFAGGIVAGESAPPAYRLRGEASVRLVDAGAMLEAPFAGERGSVMLGGRYSYTGALVSLIVPEVSVGYWDYQGRAQYRLNDRDSLSLFGFGSFDFLSAENDQGVDETIYDVTFHRLDLRYDRTLSDRSALRVATTLGIDRTRGGGDTGLRVDARSAGARIEYSRQQAPWLRLSAGADLSVSHFDIHVVEDSSTVTERSGGSGGSGSNPGSGDGAQLEPADQAFQDLFATRNDLVGGAFAEAVVDAAPGVTLTPGIRIDAYDTGGDTALALDPRLSARFQVSKRVALVHDLGIAHQPPSFSIPIPGLQARADRLQTGVLSSAGVEAKLPWELTGSATLFDNLLFNGTDALSVLQLDNVSSDINISTDRVTGSSYGLELYLRRPLSRRVGGFASYTLSRAHRSLGRLEGPSSFDRTHVLNLALSFDLGHRFRAGGRFVYYSGIPAEVAYPAAVLRPPRTPPFYRIDVRVEKRWPIGAHGAFWALVLEVLNTTLHKEVLSASCYAYGCVNQAIGPVTIPSLGLEAGF